MPSNTSSKASSEASITATIALASSLLQRCTTLLSELTAFQTFLSNQHKTSNEVELRTFKASVQSELRSLQKLSSTATNAVADLDTEELQGNKTLHALRSSNLPFYDAVWTTAKTCKGVKGFGKRMYWDTGGQSNRRETFQSMRGRELKRKSVLVDIVAGNGEEWVKVSTVTETRLLFEMAKEGWEGGGGESDEEEEEKEGEEKRLRGADGDCEADDDDDGVELVKLAEDMKKAASAKRVRYRRPKVLFVLPKITEGKTPEIDCILDKIRKTGAAVECGPGQETSKDGLANGFSTPPAPENLPNGSTDGTSNPGTTCTLTHTFETMLPNPHAHFTPILNIDCTLLLALVSDLSHYRSIPSSPTHHRAITRQIEMEAVDPLLPSELWPAMGERELVCTAEAAKRMREIVHTIGTESERRRMELLMGEGNAEGRGQMRLVKGMQELSDYDVPCGWRLPVRVIEATKEITAAEGQEGPLPAVAQKVAEQLSEINRSVFLYGWASGLTTISSNRTVARLIENLVEEGRVEHEGVTGPDVWVCGTARSLVGKEKGRRD